MSRKYNKKIRETIRPNWFDCLEKQGYIGKLLSWFGKKLIKKPMHDMNREFVQKFYDPKYDSPYKGSILYTLFDFLSYGLLFIVISILFYLLF